MSDARHHWHEALAATPECIAIERLGETLDAASQAHLESCVRCQAELALFRAMTSDVATAEEDRAAQSIAAELQRRAANDDNVVAFRPRSLRVVYSIAAALLLVIGAGWLLQMREPSVGAIDPGDLYRSARIELIAPAGDLPQAPNELRWNAVANATRYHVTIVEVDGSLLWSSDTTEPRTALPPNVMTQFAPGKSLMWEVKAFRGTEMLAASETQAVRVTVAPNRNLQ
ncbi:MAG: hypothetical protein M3Q69_09420 [Acidobacteriota bacterium]|nr:hypothetical protein [Acidobacteriota bacterium]